MRGVTILFKAEGKPSRLVEGLPGFIAMLFEKSGSSTDTAVLASRVMTVMGGLAWFLLAHDASRPFGFVDLLRLTGFETAYVLVRAVPAATPEESLPSVLLVYNDLDKESNGDARRPEMYLGPPSLEKWLRLREELRAEVEALA